MKKFAIIVAAALIAPIPLAAPAQAAPPSVTITYESSGLTKGDALTTGAQIEPFGAITKAVNAGVTVVAQVNVNYGAGAIAANSWQPVFYACPSRGSNANACEVFQQGRPLPAGLTTSSGVSTAATQGVIGKYLRLSVTATNESGTITVNGPVNDEPLVWPALATGGRPTFSAAALPGNQANISLKAWNLAAGTTFTSRTVQVWSCPAATNGQVSTYAWNARGDGCTDVSSGTTSTINTAAATTIAMNVPAGTEGRFLVVSDLVLARFGTNTTGALVRSEAVPVGVTPSPSPSASPSPSPSATIQIPVNPSARPGAAGQFRIAVISKPTVTRGARLKVTVSTSSGASIGEAVVQIKKRPTTRASAKQTLKRIDVVNGTGQSVTTVSGRLPKGSYFLVATYVDDKTKRKTIATAPLTIK